MIYLFILILFSKIAPFSLGSCCLAVLHGRAHILMKCDCQLSNEWCVSENNTLWKSNGCQMNYFIKIIYPHRLNISVANHQIACLIISIFTILETSFSTEVKEAPNNFLWKNHKTKAAGSTIFFSNDAIYCLFIN